MSLRKLCCGAIGLLAVAAAAAPRPVATPLDGAAGGVRPGARAVQRVSPGKPSGPIGVDYEVVGEVAIGQALDVVITAQVPGAAAALVLEVNARDPAALLVAGHSAPVDRDGAQTWVVTVVPLHSTTTYLNVLVVGELDGAPQARNVLIPIRVGVAEAVAAAASAVEVRAVGEALILLPAIESP
jgi:hypothetical protein